MAGFQQSYTYFTWRNTKEELEEFLTQVSQDTADFLRPNLFVNTPDILTEYLQYGGRPAYRTRAAIAATAAPTYGVYAGFELFENVARPGAEENIDNEKFQYKLRDWAAAEERGDSLAPFLRRLNEIRRAHPALRQLRNLTVHWSDDDAILVYVKHLDAALSPDGRADTIIVVVNVDPHSARETMVHLDTRVWGVDPRRALRGRRPAHRCAVDVVRPRLRAARRIHRTRPHPAREGIPMSIDDALLDTIAAGAHHDPHGVLGLHAGADATGAQTWTVRTRRPMASAVTATFADGTQVPMEHVRSGIWEGTRTGSPGGYEITASYEGGPDWTADDPYRHPPTVGELDLHLIGEGRHEELWQVLGSHTRTA